MAKEHDKERNLTSVGQGAFIAALEHKFPDVKVRPPGEAGGE